MIGTQNALGVGPSSDALLFVICSPVGPYYRCAQTLSPYLSGSFLL